MKSAADVVVIGGGIQGLSLLYQLTRLGVSDVCLLEREMLGCSSSGKSAALIGFDFQNEDCLPLTQLSFDMLLCFEDELGVDPGFRPIGVLNLAGRSASELCRRHTVLEGLGIESQILSPAEVPRLTPALNLEGIEMALYLPGAANLDPHAMMMAYAGRARRAGATILEGVAATGFRVQGGRVVAVQTAHGEIACGAVVNAAGARAAEVGRWLNLDLPIQVLKRHIVVTGPVPVYGDSIPFTYDWEADWYMSREGPGLLLGMGVDQAAPDDEAVDAEAVERLIDYATFRAPALEEAGLMTQWAGLRPVTPDEGPLLGLAPGWENAYLDCGWGGIGVMNAPGAGRALAELIVGGKPRSMDLSPFGVERFGGWRAHIGG